MAYHFSSLFANALTLHCGKYVSFTEQPLIDLCCSLFLFWGGLLDGFAFTLPSGLNNHSIHVSETSPYWLSFLPSLLLLFFLLMFTGLQQKQSDSGGKKQVFQPTACREDLYQCILHRPQHLRWLLTLDTYLIIKSDFILFFVLCIEIRHTTRGISPLWDSMAAGM